MFLTSHNNWANVFSDPKIRDYKNETVKYLQLYYFLLTKHFFEDDDRLSPGRFQNYLSRSSYSIVRFVVFSRNNKVDTIFWRINNERYYTLAPQCCDRHLDYGSNVQNFADTSRIRCIYSYVLIIEMTYLYLLELHNIVYSRHTYSLRCLDPLVWTHTHEKYETQYFVKMFRSDAEITFGEMLELWPRKTSHNFQAHSRSYWPFTASVLAPKTFFVIHDYFQRAFKGRCAHRILRTYHSQ